MKSKNHLVIITIIFCILFNLMGCTKVSVEESELSETIIIDKTDVSSENNSSVEDTPPVEEKPVVSEPTEKPVTSKEETPSSPQVKPSEPSQTTKPETKPETKPTQNQNSSSSTSGKKFVQLADPETGISWDGVSPIVYTYADGTTGTEKREGAKYEQVPGMWTTVDTIETEEKYDGTCAHCGKEEGTGADGTCLRPFGSDMNCPNCGEYLEANVCHTCNE